MKQNCIDAVNEAVGRTLSEAEIAKIETRIQREIRFVNRTPEGRALSQEKRYLAAARRAAEGLMAEQALKAKREALTVLKHAQIEDTLKGFGDDPIAGLRRLLAFHADGRGSVLSVESRRNAIEATAFSNMLATLEATNAKFFGLLENQEGVRALYRELYGEHTGNADAHEGARLFHQVAEELRLRFNDAGGKVRSLEDWGLPTHHSQSRIALAGETTWVAKVFSRLKRERYVDEAGRRMGDDAVRDFLRGSYQTLSTGGANLLEPGLGDRAAMRSNYHAAAREIHFKSADDAMAYQADFGEQSLYGVLTGHVRGLADSIAMVETLGPNPAATFKYFRDRAESTTITAKPARRGQVLRELRSLDTLFDYVGGNELPVADQRLADRFDAFRKLLVSSRLGSAFISSMPDEATMRLTAHVNGIDQLQLFRNELATLNPTNQLEKRLAMRSGLALQTAISSLNRFGDESLRNTATSKLATFSMRASGLPAITEARKRAFGSAMMSTLGHLTREADSLARLEDGDHRILLSKGISEADWKVWRLAELEDHGGGNDTMLTPQAIYRIPDEALRGIAGPEVTPQQLRREAASKLLGAVLEETNMAVVEPGARERAAMYGGLQRGTWKGELGRSIFLFKTTPIAMLWRHWERGLSMPDARSKAGYIAALLASTTVLGMAALQVDELLKGRDPKNMNPFAGKGAGRTWAAAMLKGGSLGIYGDFLFSEQSQHGGSPIASALGPVAGAAEDLFGFTQGNLVQLAQGKNTHAGAELVKLARGMTPGANTWYLKAVTDHLIFNQLAEMASPGYLSKVRARAQREFGQSFYWDPAQTAPARAPNLGAAAGR